MKKIYLILSHKNCEQLERQIRSLDDGYSTFYVHIDLKSNLHLFNSLGKMNNVFLISERVDCIWGDFSLVIATLNLIENALKNHTEGMCIFMSGNDYPIKSKSDINSFIDKNSDKIFIDINEPKNIWKYFNRRIEYYRINFSSKRGNYTLLKGLNIKTLIQYFLGRITREQLHLIAFKKRKLSLITKFYGGSQWWAMNISNLAKMNNFIQSNKEELFDFFSYSNFPDEFFFHSIIMHLKELGSPVKIESSLTYVSWSRKKCTLPVTFNINDLSELMEQPANKLFARKFDLEFDRRILDEIDKNIS